MSLPTTRVRAFRNKRTTRIVMILKKFKSGFQSEKFFLLPTTLIFSFPINLSKRNLRATSPMILLLIKISNLNLSKIKTKSNNKIK